MEAIISLKARTLTVTVPSKEFLLLLKKFLRTVKTDDGGTLLDYIIIESVSEPSER